MDTSTLDAIMQLLPDPATYTGNEYRHHARVTNKETNELIDVVLIFEKVPHEKKWIYKETLERKDLTPEP